MSHVLIHSARQLLTLRGAPGPRRGPALNQLGIIEDGAVLISDGVIVEVGPTRRIENMAAARTAQQISALGRVVMPGFVDSHTYLISGPPRLAADTVSLARTSPSDSNLVRPSVSFVREASATRLTDNAALVLRHCLAHGTTTIEAKSGYGMDSTSELKILRILTRLGDAPITVVPTFGAANFTAPEFQDRPDDYMQWLINELLPLVHKRGLARFVNGTCDRGSFSANHLRILYEKAREFGLPLKMSLAQFGPADGAALAAKFTFTSFDHLQHLTDRDVAAVAQSGAVATLTPASSFFLGSSFAPARALIDCGAAVGLATNYNRVTSPTYNMQLVIFLGCLELGMTPEEAISAATINGAYALKLGHRVGSLEAGKQADILILHVGDYRELAHEFGVNLVDLTIRKGLVVCDNSTKGKWSAGL